MVVDTRAGVAADALAGVAGAVVAVGIVVLVLARRLPVGVGVPA
jgi:hypothetical protein